MSTAAAEHANADHTAAAAVRLLYQPIRQELAEAEEILRGELTSRYPYVDELVKHGFLLGGKRLRPALLLLCAKALGGVNREHLVLAAVVEMIHTATLIHDDVLDDAVLRRHRPTVNARWDTEASILLGDFLFTHSFYLASTLGTAYACHAIGKATNIVCEGELRQKGCRGDYSITEQDYLEIIEAKTAELCACSCQLGAHFAQAGERWESGLAAYGRDLGVAFQIADDLLDVTGKESAAGKSLGADQAKQKPTLPFIRALSLANETQRRELIEIFEDESAGDELASRLSKFEAIEYARQKAVFFARRARSHVESLPPGECRQTLCSLTDFVVHRSA